MARSFRDRRFRGRSEVGEDVNPSAYIVNLADCMLVLACGFIVALVSYWGVDISSSAQEVDKSTMSEVDPTDLESDLTEDGSYYEEAGKVYRDPQTGQLYLVEESADESGESDYEAADDEESASISEEEANETIAGLDGASHGTGETSTSSSTSDLGD